jgi:hypothetical protein
MGECEDNFILSRSVILTNIISERNVCDKIISLSGRCNFFHIVGLYIFKLPIQLPELDGMIPTP